ncbi:anaerobic nitric oxide reductase flavorubredoxin [Carboxydothermus ferrireducens]|uniref:Flavorubredoxin n=1 Tax=Carboxydothermus ferrireducens DSM 11255 TaxID=1119529 RepID=A0ABX2R753_9THEO|nr:anaerobic nitric oxide reductase flavorubredoxin [Carboxydothermus ferrireducens]NYE56750.1 flavorubredoxin [Carboxydothermus ferrireducens DSM 11255]
MGVKISDSVTYVGKIDWELRRFHGEELSTHRGSSYNSYLIRDEKVALIDTAWIKFDKEYVKKLSEEIDLNKIDYVIALHGEIDHSGALPELMRHIPDKPIVCSANAVKSLKGHYHQDWNFQVVKTGDTLELGSKKLIFIEAPMLHWPDSMMAYLTGEEILFSNDAFGQHYASESLFNDLVDQHELFEEALKYYANILAPFSARVVKKIEEVLALNLPVKMIAPSHGIIWRDNPLQIVNKYLEWAKDYKENQITIIYDTMWDGTRRMAEEIARGIKAADPEVTVKLYNCARSDNNDIVVEVFRSKAILAGSPTVNRNILYNLAGQLDLIKSLQFKGKKASAFGAYGWSGEGVKIITEILKEAGFEIVMEGIRELWNPDEEALKRCFEFGKNFAQAVK